LTNPPPLWEKHGGKAKCVFTKENASARGSLGAARRWGPRRVIRLDDLDDAERALCLALIDAAKLRASIKEDSPAVEKPGESEGGRRASADNPAAA
jgi:hypothetical protein